MFRNWFTASVSDSSRIQRNRRRSRRSLRLEVLEDRTVPSTLWVDVNDPTADDPGDNLYAQIDEAVAVASPGDQINVRGGTYEPFTVTTDGLTIREANGDAIIDATGATEAGIQVDADGVTIQGLTVENSSSRGFLIVGTGNTLRDNTARNNDLTGFAVGLSFDVDASDTTLIGNTAIGNGSGSRGGSGFAMLGTSNTTLIGNTANDNGAGGFFGSPGFNFNATTGNTVTGNTADGNRRGGIVAGSTHDSSFIGNTVTGTFGVSFFFAFSGIDVTGNQNTIRGNTSSGTVAGHGFTIGGSDNTVTGNVASDNGQIGFVIVTNDSLYQGNLAQDNMADGFRLSAATGNTLKGNVAAGNLRDGFALGLSAFFGPVRNPDGTCEWQVFSFNPSDNNTFQGNMAIGNARHGFSLFAASGNTFRGNTAIDNGGDGFHLEGFDLIAPDVPFFDCINNGELIFTAHSDNNVFKGNTSVDNDGWGYYVDALLANAFDDNHAENNGLGDFNF